MASPQGARHSEEVRLARGARYLAFLCHRSRLHRSRRSAPLRDRGEFGPDSLWPASIGLGAKFYGTYSERQGWAEADVAGGPPPIRARDEVRHVRFRSERYWQTPAKRGNGNKGRTSHAAEDTTPAERRAAMRGPLFCLFSAQLRYPRPARRRGLRVATPRPEGQDAGRGASRENGAGAEVGAGEGPHSDVGKASAGLFERRLRSTSRSARYMRAARCCMWSGPMPVSWPSAASMSTSCSLTAIASTRRGKRTGCSIPRRPGRECCQRSESDPVLAQKVIHFLERVIGPIGVEIGSEQCIAGVRARIELLRASRSDDLCSTHTLGMPGNDWSEGLTSRLCLASCECGTRFRAW